MSDVKWIFPCGSGWSYCKDGFCGRYNQLKEDHKRPAVEMSKEWKEITKEDKSEAAIRKKYHDLTNVTKGNDKPPWTGQFESYTPDEYIKSVKAVMGHIELDPASCEEANKVVGAKRFFDLDEDGLRHDWFGKVFLNPPYKQPEVAYFINKLIEEYANNKVKEAILLTNNSTETKWFQDAAKFSVICFPSKRIQFEVDGVPTSPTTGQAFFYFGENNKKFVSEFSRHGMIAKVAR